MSKVSVSTQVLTEMDAGNDQQADYSFQACATAAFGFGLQVSLVLFCCMFKHCCLTMIILGMASFWHA